MKYFYIFVALISTFGYTLQSYADGIFGNELTEKEIREGRIHTDDIPGIIVQAIDFFLGIAGSIAIIAIIIGAYQILLGSIEQDKTKGKNTIIMALGGFALASLAWFIMNFILQNFGA